jgi:hypothetical protein
MKTAVRARQSRNARERRAARRTVERDAALYNALLDRYLRDGIPPTLERLARETGLSGKPSAKLAVARLARTGRVRMVRRMPVPADVLRIGPKCGACGKPLLLHPANGKLFDLEWRCPACSK